MPLPVPRVGSARGPAHRHQVPLGHLVVDGDGEIRERVAPAPGFGHAVGMGEACVPAVPDEVVAVRHLEPALAEAFLVHPAGDRLVEFERLGAGTVGGIGAAGQHGGQAR
jgi:hypothetical protein